MNEILNKSSSPFSIIKRILRDDDEPIKERYKKDTELILSMYSSREKLISDLMETDYVKTFITRVLSSNLLISPSPSFGMIQEKLGEANIELFLLISLSEDKIEIGDSLSKFVGMGREIIDNRLN